MSSTKRSKTSASTRVVRRILLCDSDEYDVPRTVTQVVFTEEVTHIRQYVFEKCEHLVQVTFPQSLSAIGEYAFVDCTSLQEVDLSKTSVKIIEEGVFSYCCSLEKISFPETLTTIESHAFADCTSLQEVDLSRTLLSKMKVLVFGNCKSLKKVILPDTLSEIGKGVFYACNSLTVLDLSMTSVQRIKHLAFYSCYSLEYIKLPKSLNSIKYSAFKGCKKLSIISIPDHVHIPFDSFKRCRLINKIRDQLKETSSSNVVDYQFLHDKHRFANLPLHQICYDPNLTLASLTSNITTAIGNKSIKNVDVFSLNALHILSMNPNVTPHMISTLVKACPSLQNMKSTVNMTPLMMFLRLKCILRNDISVNATSSLDLIRLVRYLIKHGVDWDIIQFIIELEDEMKRRISMKNEHTGLYPFMEVAMVSKGSLKTLYNITMNSDLGWLFPVLNNACT